MGGDVEAIDAERREIEAMGNSPSEGRGVTPDRDPDVESPSERAKRLFCYCDLWETHPEHFPQEGVPEGYCGFCETCGEPGHTRHFPGPVPYTGSWCEKHYQGLRFVHVGRVLLFVVVVGAAIALLLITCVV